MVDFAGGGVVHFTGGLVSLFATYVLGPRRGRFHDDDGRKLDKPRDFPGQSISLQVSSHVTTQKRRFESYLNCTPPLRYRCWER